MSVPAGPLAGVRVCCSLRSSYPLKNARAIKVAESLSAAGAEVSVLFAAPAGAALPTGAFRTVHVRQLEIRPSEHRSRIVRIAYNVLFVMLLQGLIEAPRRYGLDVSLMRAMMRERADIYHGYVLDTALPALLVGRVRHAKVVYDIRDFFVDSRRAQLSKPRAAFWTWAETYVSKRADLVVAISRPMADTARTAYGARRTAVVYNGPWECMTEARHVHHPVRLLFQGFFERDRNLEAARDADASRMGGL
jgi:hypothetical protein